MLESGDQVLLVDNKKRRYLLTLEAGGEFHSHTGVLSHDDLIGFPEGATPKSSRGSSFVAFRPTLSDFVLKMPRGAQVIYPKDLGPLLLIADIFPGAKVFESGVGSGALSMTMLRAGADITGYDIREEFVERARSNVRTMLGREALGRYKVETRDAYDGIDLVGLDRVVLDLPEPWQVVPHAAQSLQAGGIIVAYTPSILQAVRFRDALGASGFEFAETIEVLNRSWHIDGQAVRPDHRMVAHTGFLSHARLLGS
ncbi:MAG: tRNA (adenine-N1)-methyltransferase [Acidimicrobiaceae bacterium]|jgi:tRNA (adenine57-N1/adenine58-N1)-methyltransferase|nr:tRNA (adenine-N1)-methyltransferase [Acidimicrobiaceae bacterium]MDP6480289.1 tRNA (adenine-N1)-methyltransferase [Acidimicrobiales bacterium]MDP6696924.1 tRNA (adenine-N1)-methyltransferase [Acidimicrobiales bacterium]|tara:strand:+ start:9713 stop:10477 length:765 start_codon:yes stop_codon:yes gene_type:complete